MTYGFLVFETAEVVLVFISPVTEPGREFYDSYDHKPNALSFAHAQDVKTFDNKHTHRRYLLNIRAAVAIKKRKIWTLSTSPFILGCDRHPINSDK